MDSKLRFGTNPSSEKMAALKRVFDAICHEFKIPLAAKSERNNLAYNVLAAAQNIEHEPCF